MFNENSHPIQINLCKGEKKYLVSLCSNKLSESLLTKKTIIRESQKKKNQCANIWMDTKSWKPMFWCIIKIKNDMETVTFHFITLVETFYIGL